MSQLFLHGAPMIGYHYYLVDDDGYPVESCSEIGKFWRNAYTTMSIPASDMALQDAVLECPECAILIKTYKEGASHMIQGKRIDRLDDSLFEPGEYGKANGGRWLCHPPNAPEDYFIGDISNHKITEHDDGTITVSPSILITYEGSDGKKTWHGFLKRGIWRKV